MSFTNTNTALPFGQVLLSNKRRITSYLLTRKPVNIFMRIFFSVNLLLAKIHVGPQGILTPEKLQELIEATGCIPEIENPDCPPETIKYRTIDGTCNNRRIGSTTNGAAETGFQRFLPALYFGPEGLDGPARDQPNAPDLPNPSLVTTEYIVIQSINQLNRDGIKHMFMQWGQFLDHDQTLAPESENGDVCEDVP